MSTIPHHLIRKSTAAALIVMSLTRPGIVDACAVGQWLNDGAETALLDIREAGRFGEGHPFFAVPLPYSRPGQE